YFSQTNSTIDQMKKLITNKITEGTLVVAERQLQGRGRLQRKWESPLGGIWVSVFLKPDVLPCLIPQLNLISALVVARTIEKKTGIKALLKWPNDVVIKGQKKDVCPFRKICGILAEMNAETDRINYVILSFGVNANIAKEQFSESLREKVVSLQDLLGREISRVSFLKELLLNLEEVYLKFKKGNTGTLLKEYKKKSIVLGKRIKVIFPDNQVVSGKVVDIDKEGALILKAGKENKRVVAGEVIF
ncbi:biotin--[acetyl-CoA-carboxylase] ligase, partial [bacterium]|nr:biotin--[acetyl-CoA-carboxylase] ligase [bacterium]